MMTKKEQRLFNKQNGIKVITKHSYKWWGLLSNFITYGTPIIYILIKYEVFRTNVAFQITPIGWLVAIVLFMWLKKQILLLIDKFKENSAITKRFGLVLALSIFVLVLIFSVEWIEHLIFLLLAWLVGLLLSMFPYFKYKTNYDRYIGLKELQTNEKDKQAIKEGKLLVK